MGDGGGGAIGRIGSPVGGQNTGRGSGSRVSGGRSSNTSSLGIIRDIPRIADERRLGAGGQERLGSDVARNECLNLVDERRIRGREGTLVLLRDGNVGLRDGVGKHLVDQGRLEALEAGHGGVFGVDAEEFRHARHVRVLCGQAGDVEAGGGVRKRDGCNGEGKILPLRQGTGCKSKNGKDGLGKHGDDGDNGGDGGDGRRAEDCNG